jgi:1,4-alpha-glucan branching enzyme
MNQKMFMPKSKNSRTKENKPDISASITNTASNEVDFVLEYIGADQIYVSGDFNDWQPACLRMIGNPDAGLWEKRLTLLPGRYEYKFIADGKWMHDPDARENVPNIYGSLNSVLEVKS